MKQSASIWIGVLGIILLVIIFSSAKQSPQTTSQAVTLQRIPSPQISISQVQIDNLRLSPQSAGLSGYQLTGKVTNNSSISFQGINMTIEAYDCPDQTIDSTCAHIGEDKNVELFVNGDGYAQFPPNQIREASALVTGLSGMPPIQGHFLWSYSITGFTDASYNPIPMTQ